MTTPAQPPRSLSGPVGTDTPAHPRPTPLGLIANIIRGMLIGMAELVSGGPVRTVGVGASDLTAAGSGTSMVASETKLRISSSIAAR